MSLKISFSKETLRQSCEIARSELEDIICEYADVFIDIENTDNEIVRLEKLLYEKKRTREELKQSEEFIANKFTSKKRSVDALESLTGNK